MRASTPARISATTISATATKCSAGIGAPASPSRQSSARQRDVLDDRDAESLGDVRAPLRDGIRRRRARARAARRRRAARSERDRDVRRVDDDERRLAHPRDGRRAPASRCSGLRRLRRCGSPSCSFDFALELVERHAQLRSQRRARARSRRARRARRPRTRRRECGARRSSSLRPFRRCFPRRPRRERSASEPARFPRPPRKKPRRREARARASRATPCGACPRWDRAALV